MADWDDGYVTDVPYVADYHRETLPIWIATTAAIFGHAAPDIARPFRYADLGCGSGVTPLVVAATMPHAEVWAFDFNPHHIAAGRDIAHRAGLGNIRFIEASFEDLVREPAASPLHPSPDPAPDFDFVIAHGVLSWISRENQRHLFGAIGRMLAPGGIAYVSYNVGTGWGAIRPVATLMRLLAEASPERTDRALNGVFDTLDTIRAAGAGLFDLHPDLAARLAGFRARNQRYVAHELLNGNWRPLMFPTVAAAMAEVKCGYIGSATPADNVAGLTVPAGARDLFHAARDLPLRETLRDLCGATTFRRDLYQRGPRPMTRLEYARETDAITLVRTPRPTPSTILLDTALGRVQADQPRFHAMLRALDSGPATIGQLRASPEFAGEPGAALLEVAAVLLGAFYLAPMVSEEPAAAAIAGAARLNAVHAALFDRGEDRPYLACPALAAALPMSGIELLALDELRAGRPPRQQPLADAVRERVARSRRRLRRDGEPVLEPGAEQELVTDRIRDTLSHLPLLRRLGALS